jgi:hypothetical protein
MSNDKSEEMLVNVDLKIKKRHCNENNNLYKKSATSKITLPA